MSLGTIANARIAHSIVYNGNEDDVWDIAGRIPAGWRLLGTGATRHAILGPDGVVYKVAYDEEGGLDTNANEVEAAKKRRRIAELRQQDIFIPKMRLLTVNDKPGGRVTAMEFIDGKPTRCSFYNWSKNSKCNCRTFGTPRICFSLMHDLLSDWGFYDMFSANVLYTSDNKMYIIDLGAEES